MRFDDRPKPGDWTCPDCGVNVFARKQVCFRCGAQRPGSRGGFGSGGNRPDAPYMRTSRNPNPNEPYMREPGDTNDEIDVPLVEMMVLERASLRAKGDFGAADAVRDELALMGVTVHDRERRWFSSDFDPRLSRGLGPNSRKLPTHLGVAIRPAPPPPGTAPEHDYVPQGEEAVAVAEQGGELLATIDGLLAKRLGCKAKGRYNQADSLKQQLKGLGVSVRDRSQTWSFRAPPPRDFGPKGHDYARAQEDEAPLDEEDLARIDELLAARLQHKIGRRFEQADRCLAELRDDYGVFVNDKLKGWRADGGIFPTHARVEGDGDASPAGAALDQAAVLELIASRAAAKKARDYAAADAAVAALLAQHAVVLDDKRGTWRVVRLVSGFHRVGPTPEPSVADAVPPLLAALAAAREDGASREADATLDELEELGVGVDEDLCTWRVLRTDAGGRPYPARPDRGARGRGRAGGRGRAAGRGGGW